MIQVLGSEHEIALRSKVVTATLYNWCLELVFLAFSQTYHWHTVHI